MDKTLHEPYGCDCANKFLKKKQLSSPNTGETKSMFISLFLEKRDIFVD